MHDIAINPYMDFIGYCILNKFRQVSTGMSIREFIEMDEGARIKTIDRLIDFCGVRDSVTVEYGNDSIADNADKLFFSFRILNDEYEIVRCRFFVYKREIGSASYNFETVWTCHLLFANNPSFDYTGVERSKNYLDFSYGGTEKSSMDSVFACLCGLLDIGEFVKFHKTRCLKSKTISSFCEKRLSKLCDSAGCVYDFSNFTIYAMDGKNLYYREIGLDDYMKELIDFENKLKEVKNADTN